LHKLRISLRTHAIPVLLVLSVALLCAHLSVQLRASTFPKVFAGELGIFEGTPLYPEFQNRILSPALLIALRKLFPADVSDKSVWFAFRVLQASMSFTMLYVVAFRLTDGRLRALAAVALVAFAYAWTPLSHPWEYPTDFFDILFMALIVGLALTERSIALGVVVIVAAMNRESAAFAGIVWMALAAMRHKPWLQKWRMFLPGVVYIALAALVIFALRVGLGGESPFRQEVGVVEAFAEWDWIRHPDGSLPLLICLLFAFVVLLRALPRPWNVDQKGLLLAAAGCALVSFTFGIIGELRVALPCVVILSLLAVCGASGRTDRDWVLSLVR
jgi:hypothetical protein